MNEPLEPILQESDETILPGLRRGDEKAYRTLFEQYYPILVAFACKYVESTDAAKEVVQEVFIKLYQSRETLQIKQSVKSYLFKAVYHTCINDLHAQQRRKIHHHQAFEELPTSAYRDDLVETEAVERVYQAVQKLPDQCRRIFTMNRFEGMTNQAIANELNLSKRTVETQVSKALRLLREALLAVLVIIWGW